MATTTPALAALIREDLAGFIATLPVNAASKLQELAPLTVSLSSHRVISIPPAIPSGTTAEGSSIRFRDGALIANTVGPTVAVKCGAFITRELAKSPNAVPVVGYLLRADAALSRDTLLLSTASGGLRNGISAIPSSSAGGEDAIKEDAINLATAATGNGYSGQQLAFVMNPLDALKLSIISPTTAAALLIVTTNALASGVIVCVDPGSLVFGSTDDDALELATSAETVIHAEDTNPAQISIPGSPPVLSHPAVSMFQTDSIAIRLVMDMLWARTRVGAVSWIADADWTL